MCSTGKPVVWSVEVPYVIKFCDLRLARKCTCPIVSRQCTVTSHSSSWFLRISFVHRRIFPGLHFGFEFPSYAMDSIDIHLPVFWIHSVDAANPQGMVKILHLMLAHTVIISSGVSHWAKMATTHRVMPTNERGIPLDCQLLSVCKFLVILHPNQPCVCACPKTRPIVENGLP